MLSLRCFFYCNSNNNNNNNNNNIKQLLDEAFVICRIINVEVRVTQKPNPIIVLLYISSGENHKLNPIIVL